MYLKLIKLLWATDRLSLRNFGNDVTSDHYSALRYGPVASEAYNLMKVCKPDAEVDPRWTSESDALWWKEHFETQDYALVTISDPGSDYLSPADILMLETAYNLFRETGRFETVNNISHIYPEWEKAFKPSQAQRSFRINPVDFFDDPKGKHDPYFQVDPETLEAARYFFNERQELSKSLRIAL
ncbi:Panacea domain-containing protein [Corynebacterium phocae]|nr:Panacea domain-containing protein [Corynebacterium phocae]